MSAFIKPAEDDWETSCPNREDGFHCEHWYDGAPCCACGEAMNFGQALEALKNGDGTKVQRAGWNGKGMWLGLQAPDANSKMGMHYIYLSTVDGKLVPWNPNNIDMLAEDWQICD